ncbi:histidine phosphatase family protein [Rhodococcus sp. BP-252]|uniref:Phosphoglycerate mutase n=1 Tax=Rhodococcoides kyotonense TaxID=398843 RepID=A0A177YAM5_9NOCA|nr:MULTISPECIES: histidine phosphatase family protein [Rhodococcus]MBY6411588.1 histidine phosphatase family protein [Rhodococcus sp. BP-320]MBY6417970.1 histidine phosphatase family protein [Rhodococcus sp. BP-321]MBY6422129.1 histidine phosphatase family protein [Rhodococcus sp. BP-324]MBY6427768.1 histidine phosphatase family protein [Rhodococcus sp. BP-323]MBY6433013.1 histidine phosphatase family protein [Rhodococcus sp. BP-322]
MIEVLFVRHGQPVSRVRNPSLAPEGIADARRLATWLRHEQIDAVVSSPLVRARETADELAAGMGRSVDLVLEDLREWDDDIDPEHYMAVEDMASDDPRLTAVTTGNFEAYVPGLDLPKFRARARSGLEQIFDRYPSGRVVAVAHGGVINAAVADVLDMPKTFWHNPAYTSVARVQKLDSGVVVVASINDTAHLRGTVNA